MGDSNSVSIGSLDDRELLDHLLDGSGEWQDAAWTAFLDRYSDLILKVAWRFASDRDAVMEMYLHVCEHLAADDFAKLRTYDPTRGERSAKVSTWLTVVVQNLCAERRRQMEGRRRYPEAVRDLSALDQRVFELYFWEGYSPRKIMSILKTSSEHDEKAVPSALNRLRSLDLRPSKTWARQPLRRFDSFIEALHERQNSPEKEQEKADQRQWLEHHVDGLPPKERLAVRWYYWTDMSASGISQLLQVSQRTVYTLLERGLQALRERIDVHATDS